MPSAQVHGESLKIGLVTTDFPREHHVSSEEAKIRDDEIRELLQKASSSVQTLELIVFPETGGLISGFAVEPKKRLREIFGKSAPAVLDTAGVRGSEGDLKRLYLYDRVGELRGTYDKIFLVPQAEYMPALFRMPLKIIGGETFAHNVSVFSSFARGREAHPLVLGAAKIGALICSDLLSPYLYADLTQDGASILVNVGGDGWFHHGYLANTFVLTLAKVRAVENDRYLLLAINGQRSVVISNSGEIAGESPIGGLSLLSAEVPLISSETVYSRFGESVLVVPLILFLLIFAIGSGGFRKRLAEMTSLFRRTK